MMNSTSPVILVMGYPASGKGSHVKSLAGTSCTILNRDTEGGTVINLLPKFTSLLNEDRNHIILDNTFLTVESRKPFIEAAKMAGRDIECHWLQTSFEDCQVNALNRMWDRYGRVFLTASDIKAHAEAKVDPNIFPVAALFAAKKRLNGVKKRGVWEVPSGKPTKDEGFSRIVKVPFIRRPFTGSCKALILDYDGTLRRDAKLTGGEQHYPTKPEEVKILPNRSHKLMKYREQGYLLLGITTQSGIGKGIVDDEMVRRCLGLTNHLLGLDIHYLYCPHHMFPVGCYCRKPQAGLGVQLIREHDLNPSECIFVGDRTSDRTFAERCGFQFIWAKDFFHEKAS